MVIALAITGAAFAAFCVWLAVRIVNRKERWAKWTLAMTLSLPVLYVASFGPACWISSWTETGESLLPVAHEQVDRMIAGPPNESATLSQEQFTGIVGTPEPVTDQNVDRELQPKEQQAETRSEAYHVLSRSVESGELTRTDRAQILALIPSGLKSKIRSVVVLDIPLIMSDSETAGGDGDGLWLICSGGTLLKFEKRDRWAFRGECAMISCHW